MKTIYLLATVFHASEVVSGLGSAPIVESSQQHHLLAFLQDTQAKVEQIKLDVGHRRFQELGSDLKERIAHILEDVNAHLGKKVRQDFDNTQKFIDDSLDRLRAKTRLSVEMKIGSDMADTKLVQCRSDEKELLGGSLLEFEKLGQLQRDKEAKCTARDALRTRVIEPIAPTTTECNFMDEFECEGLGELDEAISQQRREVLDHRKRFRKAKAECEAAMGAVDALIGGGTLGGWTTSYFSKKKLDCDKDERYAWSVACTFGNRLQEKCAEKTEIDRLVHDAKFGSGTILSQEDRAKVWRTTRGTHCFLSNFQEGGLMDAAAHKECLGDMDFEREVGVISDRSAEIAVLMTSEQFSCDESEIPFSGYRWTTGQKPSEYVKENYAAKAVLSPVGAMPFEFCDQPEANSTANATFSITTAEVSDEDRSACNIVTDVNGVAMVCPTLFEAHPEQEGICSLRAEGGQGGASDPTLYKLPSWVSEESWPNSRWMIPTPGAPTLDGASFYFEHGAYITSGAPTSLCANETVNASANATAPPASPQFAHAPRNGSCALNYELRAGSLTNYGQCDGSEEVGYCILPADKAAIVCEADPQCAGTSATANEVWKKSYPGYQLLGRLPVTANAEWSTCLKAASGRTWDAQMRESAQRRAELLVGGAIEFK